MGAPQRYIWMLVTRDEYELPLVVADSAKELARLIGVNYGTIARADFNHTHYGRKSQYVKVPI